METRSFQRSPIRRALAALLLALLALWAPSVQAAPQPIFEDALAAGWQNWSWATVNLAVSNPVHAGNRSIGVTYGGWQGLYLSHSGASTLGFTKVRFFVHGGSTGGQQYHLYAVRASDPGGSHGPEVILPAPTANAWQQVEVSLSSLGAADTTITGLVWQDRSGGNQPTLYLDDIALVSDESPDGPALSQGEIRPGAAPADGQTQVIVRARVTDPQGAADIRSVTLDAAALGRGTVTLLDDGFNNDGAANDGLFGARFTVAPGTASGEHMLVVTAEDQANHRATLVLGAFVVLTPPGGTIPAALPTRLSWGTNEWSESGPDWQVNSGVPWDYAYQYITYEWYVEGWGGNFVGRFVNQAWNKNYIPVVSVYLMLAVPPNCGEGNPCYAQKLQNATTVSSYLTALGEAARQANGTRPVIFQLEPDFYGYMQQYTNSPSRPAGVRVDDPTSIPVALNINGYPNDLTGFGRRMVDVIRANAPNVLIAPHASAWATDSDPNLVTPAGVISMAQRTATFMNAMGGSQADLFSVEWSDRDSGSGLRPWWDDTNRTLPRHSRAMLWKNSLSATANKRLILWQIPVGNMGLDNTCNRYRDNRVNYISWHPRDLADAGVIGFLFGGGANCMTKPSTDGGFLAAQATIAFNLPSAPTGLGATSVNAGTARLRWNDNPEPDHWGYRVNYEPEAGGTTTTLEVRRANSTLFSPGPGRWRVTVTAYDAMGRLSPASASIIVNLGCLDLAPPTGVGIEDIQPVAARWQQAATSPYDVDGDSAMTARDIQLIAAQWESACQ